jgi:DNA repair photolyase
MAVIEIQAKTMLAHIREPDGIFGMRYNMNLYRGCQHQCIYCDSRSECYGIENFHDIQVKVNAIELLKNELPRKRVKGTIGTGSMNDPYMPVEKHYNLTGRSLALFARYAFGVHINTKSDLILRDTDLLLDLTRTHASVCFSISTADDELGRKLEPAAPLVSARYAAMKQLAQRGILVGVSMMPILPFLEDTPENITAIVEKAVECGARFIVPWFGMSMRDRQRAYYYVQLDRLFPGLRQKYERAFGSQYGCPARNAKQLADVFEELRARYHLGDRVPYYRPSGSQNQLSLF